MGYDVNNVMLKKQIHVIFEEQEERITNWINSYIWGFNKMVKWNK